MEQQKAKDPGAKLCYHSLVDAPTKDDPGVFEVKLTNLVVFIPGKQEAVVEEGAEGEGAKIMTAQTNVAAMNPFNSWETTVSKTVWSVKWGANGLMPIRPQVILTLDVDLASGMAMSLS